MNNGSRSARIFYIIIVPIILVVVLLNSGLLQAWFTAAECGGKRFSAVQYNYYYFSCLNEFIDENEDRLDSLGFDQDKEPRDQNYDAGTTWEDYFRQLADSRISYAVYYNTLADEAGYECPESDLSAVQAQIEQNQLECSSQGLTIKNYYKAYYGSGMTELRYQNELTYEVRAQAYAQTLLNQYAVSEDEIALYLTENNLSDYNAVNIRLITMNAVPDRFTNEVGEPQLDALSKRLSLLSMRLEEQPDQAEALAKTYSSDKSAASGGFLTDQTRSTLPSAIADWCLDSGRKTGDICSVVDSETGIAYWVYFDSFGDSGAAIEAQAAIRLEAAASREAQELPNYCVTYNAFGMTLAG